MYIISVEGNIGSGKSTLIKYMKEQLTELNNIPIIYLPEPVHIWESIKSVDGKNMIQKFYEDQEKYSFSFQMMAYISRLKIFKDAMKKNPETIIITERCLLTDYNIFAKMLYESGKMLKEEYYIYKQWFDYFNDININHIVYIKTDPVVSYERCMKRNRSGEKNISLEYLQECNQMHEEWINTVDDVYTMDGNIDNLMDNYGSEINIMKRIMETKIEMHVKENRVKNILSCIETIGNIMYEERFGETNKLGRFISDENIGVLSESTESITTNSDNETNISDNDSNNETNISDNKTNDSNNETNVSDNETNDYDNESTESITTNSDNETNYSNNETDDICQSLDSIKYKIPKSQYEELERKSCEVDKLRNMLYLSKPTETTNGITITYHIKYDTFGMILFMMCIAYMFSNWDK